MKPQDAPQVSLSKYRELFPITRKWRYFMNNSHTPAPETVRESLDHFLEMWNEGAAESWDEWIAESGRVADQIGRIIGAKPGTVAIHANVSTLLAMLLSSYDFRSTKRNKIVYTEMDFPTIGYLADAWRAYGARTVMVKSRDGIGIELEDLLNEIDEETWLVPTCHAFFNSSFLQDIPRIAEHAHRVGALVCADVYQSAGAMPVDVASWNVDFAVGGCHKYLCGGSGTCYLYVRSDHQKLMPKITGWLAHEDPFAMKNVPMKWREGITRFRNGAPAVAPLYIAKAGLSLIEEIGAQRIRQESEKHTSRLIEWSDQLGLELKTPRELRARGAAVHVRFPGVEAVQTKLKERGFLVHYRDAFHLRIAPHFYNTIEEIDGLMQAIGELRG
jgi:kynureninase